MEFVEWSAYNEDYHVFKNKIYKRVAYIKQCSPYYLE